MMRLVPVLIACSVACVPAWAADTPRDNHERATALSAEAFAEMDRLMTTLAKQDQAPALVATAQALVERSQPRPPPPPAAPPQVTQPAPVAPGSPALSGPSSVPSTAPLATGAMVMTVSSPDPVVELNRVIATLGLGTGIQERNAQTLIVSTGVAQVQGRPGSPLWIESRAVAYQTAALRARAATAAVLGEAVLSGRALSVLETPPQLDSGAPPPASRQQITAQAASLQQVALDAELRKLGVPPAQYEQLPPEQRRALYVERYEQSIRTRAAAALAGCATLAVTEGPWQGNPTICVALVWSQNLARLAALGNRFGTSLPPKPPAPGPRILEQIPADPAQLARRFGVQRYVDETGDIVVVAYAQSALVGAGPAMRATALSAAFDKAGLEAKAMLKDFLWQETSTEANRSFSQMVETTIGERSGEAQTVVRQQQEYQRSIRAKSDELSLVGASELRRWTAAVDGSEAAGVVFAWSPRRTRLAAAALQGQGSEVTGPAAAPAAGGVGTSTFDPAW